MEASTDLTVDLLEVLADAQLEEGLARDLPLLGSLVKVARLGRSASDALLLAKVRAFMRSVDNVSEDDRARFAYDMKRDRDLRDRVAESVTFALNQADGLDKAAILAVLFRALVRKQLDVASFRRLTSAVNQVFAADLRAAADHHRRGQEVPADLLRRLLPSGIAELPASSVAPLYPGGVPISLTPQVSTMGQLLLNTLIAK
jgi:hypothetical protein